MYLILNIHFCIPRNTEWANAILVLDKTVLKAQAIKQHCRGTAG
jgi:hypothetical protein